MMAMENPLGSMFEDCCCERPVSFNTSRIVDLRNSCTVYVAPEVVRPIIALQTL